MDVDVTCIWSSEYERDISILFRSFQIGVSGPELRHLKLPRKTEKSLSQLV